MDEDMKHLAEYAGARVVFSTANRIAPAGLPDTVRDSTPVPTEEAGAAPPCPEPGTLWMHVESGDVYSVVGPGKAELPGGCWQTGVAYVAHEGGDGTVFIRPLNRFHTRFKEVRLP